MTAPLSEVRVVELSSWMASSSAGAVLADLGADVVKVEPLAGDPMRGMSRLPKRAPGEPPLDAPSRSTTGASGRWPSPSTGRRAPSSSAASSPAPTCSCRNLLPAPPAPLRPGCRVPAGASTPASSTPRFTGYGTTGPDAERPGYDVTAFFGRGAITDSMTEPDGVAPQPRPAQGDHAAAMALVAGVLAALRLAERTGEGQVVEASLLGTATWTMATDLAPVLVDGRQPEQARPSPPDHAAGQPVPLRRRPLDRAEHARGPLVAEVLPHRRSGGVARRSSASRRSRAGSTTCPS